MSGPTTHVVRDGECLKSIAQDYGFFWETLWKLPENKKLKDKRGNPDVLMTGDEVFVPELREKKVSLGVEKRHRFKRKGVPSVARFKMMRGGEPRKDLPWTLDVDGKKIEGVTDANGLIEAPLPLGAKRGHLTLQDGEAIEEYDVTFAGLDPVTEPTGARQRLRSLGYEAPEDDDALYEQALSAFQSAREIDVTGKLDDKTQDELVKAYGC
jgi:hypothetical protein